MEAAAVLTFPAQPEDHNLRVERKIFNVAAIAAGVQFGWALQLSLLIPYVQLLGVPHTWAAFIWLYGAISGMVAQPLVGYYSDRCTSNFGRRRPFIVAGAALVAFAMFLIGFAADIGHSCGDSYDEPFKARAIAVFGIGYWILGVANNMLQGPCRAFLLDLSAGSQEKTRMANSMFCFFMAVGNILGFAAGSYTHLYQMIPFTKTRACDIYCANLKSCLFISVVLLFTVTAVAIVSVPENPESRPDDDSDVSRVDGNETRGENNNWLLQRYSMPFFREIFGALSNLRRPMWVLLLVTCLNWIAWFPFLIFDTDWMGREVYGGQVGEGRMYAVGVRAGSFGLMLNSIVLGFMSLWMEFLAHGVDRMKWLWGIVNFILAACLALTVLITKLAESSRQFMLGGSDLLPPPPGIKIGSLVIFAALGIPLAVTNIIPFALASIFSNSSGNSRGLSIGILNLAIVVPQMLISVTSGPWDGIFGVGNLPAFVMGAIAAAVSGVLALTMLPSAPPEIASAVISSMPSG